MHNIYVSEETIPPYDQIMAKAIMKVMKVLEKNKCKYDPLGEERYGTEHYRTKDIEHHFKHLMHHAMMWRMGDTSEDHISHMATRALMMLEVE